MAPSKLLVDGKIFVQLVLVVRTHVNKAKWWLATSDLNIMSTLLHFCNDNIELIWLKPGLCCEVSMESRWIQVRRLRHKLLSGKRLMLSLILIC